MHNKLFLVLFVVALCLAPMASTQKVSDAESTSHVDSSALYQIVDTYVYSSCKVVQFKLALLSHYSYLLISGKEALVVDPGRDVYAYLDTAKKENVSIQGVLLTHSHADFVAGHNELAKTLSCPIYISATSGAEYECKTMKEGDTVTLESTVVKFVATPGHTPDSMCLYVYGNKSQNKPELIFTGDTLFVGSVGRPDLLEGKMAAATLASMMFDTWTEKLSKVGDDVVIFPAHGAGSLCGANLSDKPFSTIGEEKKSNSYLAYTARSDFIAAVLEGLTEAPQYFAHNALLNRQGPPLVDWQAALPAELTATPDLSDVNKHYVVDLRNAQEFAAGHIPNAVNIGLRGRFEMWTGSMVPWGAPLVLAGTPKELTEAMYRLHRIGYKADVITMHSWQNTGQALLENSTIKPAELYRQMQKGEAPVIVDVRLPAEWMALRIGSVVNLPLNDLSKLAAKLDAAQPVVTVCDTAYRSSMAVGILERQGFTKVSNLAGGSEAWLEAGLPVRRSETEQQAASQPQNKRQITLADRIAPVELKRLMLDLPGTFELVDIRPAAAFADFHLPQARNVDIADLLYDPSYLSGAGSIIIVDRDGSLAMMVAGVLSQKTQRNIKALYGGLQAYWAESELKPVDSAQQTPAKPGETEKPASVTPTPQPKSEQKKSAGC